MNESITGALLFLLLAQAAGPTQSFDEILKTVSTNVKQFQDTVPDFICDERITSTSFESGKMKKQKTVDTTFRITGGVRGGHEHRDVRAIDDKPARNAEMPVMPVNFIGTFSSLVIITFSPDFIKLHNYRSGEKPDEAATAVIEFATEKDQQAMIWTFNGHQLLAMDTGKAWIDTTAMQVYRIERRFYNLPRDISRLKVTADYGPKMIGDAEFWLPKIFRVDVTDNDPKKTGLFVAQYTGCKKFEAQIRIVP